MHVWKLLDCFRSTIQGITYMLKYMKVTSSSKYVFHWVPINRTSFCTDDSARQPFHQLWWKILKRDLHTSLRSLPKPVLNIFAHFTLPFVELPIWRGDFSSFARIHVLFILMSLHLRTQVPSKLEWSSSYPSFVRLIWLGHILVATLSVPKKKVEIWNVTGCTNIIYPHQGCFWEKLAGVLRDYCVPSPQCTLPQQSGF